MIGDPSRSPGTAYRGHTEPEQQPENDWSDCPLVERNPLKLSGVHILKGTRLQADSVVENNEHRSPVEEIADNFDIPERIVRDILTLAAAPGGYREL